MHPVKLRISYRRGVRVATGKGMRVATGKNAEMFTKILPDEECQPDTIKSNTK